MTGPTKDGDRVLSAAMTGQRGQRPVDRLDGPVHVVLRVNRLNRDTWHAAIRGLNVRQTAEAGNPMRLHKREDSVVTSYNSYYLTM